MIGALFGLLFTYLLAKYYLTSYQLYPMTGMDGLYQYIENTNEMGFQFARIFG